MRGCPPAQHAQVAGTPAEVVAACDITLAMLSDPEACLAVAKGARCNCSGAGIKAAEVGCWMHMPLVDLQCAAAWQAELQLQGMLTNAPLLQVPTVWPLP